MENIPNNYYFTKTEQQACIDYNNTTDVAEKERIYNTHIHPVICKIAECVAHRFRFEYARNEEGDENLVKSAVAHMATILPLYDIKRGKAYSFFSYCCKNFLIQENDRSYKRQLRDKSIDIPENTQGATPGVSPSELSYDDPYHQEIDMEEFMAQSAQFWETRGKKYCNEPSHKVILTELIKLMKDPELVIYTHGSGQKNIFESLRQTTHFKTARISSFIRRIRNIQKNLFQEYKDTGFVTGNTIPAGRWNWKTKNFVFDTIERKSEEQ